MKTSTSKEYTNRDKFPILLEGELFIKKEIDAEKSKEAHAHIDREVLTTAGYNIPEGKYSAINITDKPLHIEGRLVESGEKVPITIVTDEILSLHVNKQIEVTPSPKNRVQVMARAHLIKLVPFSRKSLSLEIK